VAILRRTRPLLRRLQRYSFRGLQWIFSGDASWGFALHNETSEGSVLMWFDDHPHPVDSEALDPVARPRCTRRRTGNRWPNRSSHRRHRLAGDLTRSFAGKPNAP
jgi:hypothetical protein